MESLFLLYVGLAVWGILTAVDYFVGNETLRTVAAVAAGFTGVVALLLAL